MICRPASRWGDGAGIFPGVRALVQCLSKSKPFQQASSCDVKPDTHQKFVSAMGNRPRQAAVWNEERQQVHNCSHWIPDLLNRDPVMTGRLSLTRKRKESGEGMAKKTYLYTLLCVLVCFIFSTTSKQGGLSCLRSHNLNNIWHSYVSMKREYNSRVSSKNSERLLKNFKNTTVDYFFIPHLVDSANGLGHKLFSKSC